MFRRLLNYTIYGVASGGIAFEPVGVGTTTVDAAISGFITTTAGTVPVSVTAAPP